jgi:hypothetical protein
VAVIRGPSSLLCHVSSKEANALLVLVLEVHTAGRLAGIRGIADSAGLPVLMSRHICELALKAEGVVDVGEAELDVIALGLTLVRSSRIQYWENLRPLRSYRA